jgi:nickel/cobalt exporter
LIGIAAGLSLTWLVDAESGRGEIAAWLLTAFGLVYLVWGVRRAWRARPHAHRHDHLDGHSHEHVHTHTDGHAHVHVDGKVNITPWVLFTIFVFGPCEPLIPLLMFPAAAESLYGVLLVAGVFAVATIGMMMTITMLATYGLNLVPWRRMERYSHALAGAMIFLCGVAIHLGL